MVTDDCSVAIPTSYGVRATVTGTIPASPTAPIITVKIPTMSARDRSCRSADCSAATSPNRSADNCTRYGTPPGLREALGDRQCHFSADEEQNCQQVLHLRISLFKMVMEMSPRIGETKTITCSTRIDFEK